jgi:hypothetical protein
MRVCMSRNRMLLQIAALLAAFAVSTASDSELGVVHASTSQNPPQTAAAQQDQPSLIIENDSQLPDTFPQARYEVRLNAHGGVPVLHWKFEKGAMPPGMKIEDDGLLHGTADRTGEFQFTASVTDGGKPQQSVQKQFVIRVRSAMALNWKAPAHVTGSRIDGSVEVSNTTPDDIDLTFDVKAVQENGRATEIGYQHFVLRQGVTRELPFGETLPHGGYVVYVNAAGEVASKKLIYHERMQTPGPLQVTVGP